MSVYLCLSSWYGSIFSNIRSFFPRLHRLFPLLSAFTSAHCGCLQGPVLQWESVSIIIIPLLTLTSAPEDILEKGVSAVDLSIGSQCKENVNETLTLANVTRSQLWIINEWNTICEYLRLMTPWMKPFVFFTSIAKTHYACTYLEGLFSAPLLCNFSLVIAKLVPLYIASILIYSSGRVTDGAQPFSTAHTNGLTVRSLVACLGVSVWF